MDEKLNLTKEMSEALDLFLKNPFWKEYYETAPTERLRDYITLEFYNSLYEDKSSLEMMKSMEDKLNLTEWKHLRKYCGNDRRKLDIKHRIERLRPSWTIPIPVEKITWKRLYDGDILVYEGYVTGNKTPSGAGAMYYPNGKIYQEGIWGGKGLLLGREYFPNGQLRFDGVYQYNGGYGPNYPVYGRCYADDGSICFEGKLKVHQSGLGWPFVDDPEEFGKVPQEDRPKVLKWDDLTEVKATRNNVTNEMEDIVNDDKS